MAWLTNYDYRKKITLATSTYLGGNVTNDHAILVVQDSGDSAFWSHVKTNGEDVRFTSADETTELKYHFENFNHTTDDMVAWVKVVDTFDAGTNTEIYMYYGYAAAADGQDENNTYPANHLAVWHMGDSSTPQHDSTSNGYDLTLFNTPTLQETGKIDDAMKYEKASSEHAINTTVMNDTTTQFSILLWTKKPDVWDSSSTPQEYVYNKSNNANIDLFTLQRLTNGKIHSRIKASNVNSELNSAKTSWAADTWFHIVVVFDSVGNKHTMYVNGSTTDGADASPAFGTWSAGTHKGFLLNAAWEPQLFGNTTFDEIKILYDTALTADEVKLIYRSENQDLQSYGSEEEPPVTGQYFNMKGYW